MFSKHEYSIIVFGSYLCSIELLCEIEREILRAVCIQGVPMNSICCFTSSHIPDEQFLSFRALSQAMFLKWIFERGFQSGLAECCFVFESLLCEAHKAYNKREEQANKKETEG